MKLVWSASKNPLSCLIRFVTGQDCSHFSFVFESRASGLMFESNLFGTHPAFYRTSLKKKKTIQRGKSKRKDTFWVQKPIKMKNVSLKG